MASWYRTVHRLSAVVERVALAVLIGLAAIGVMASFILGPAVIVVVLLIALLALIMEQVERRSEAERAADLAAAAGVRGPISVWGKVVDVFGRCPTDHTPQRGQAIVVAGGRVWPDLCVHARDAILSEATLIERDPELDSAPVRFHDADHEFDIELYRAPAHLKAA